MVRIKFVVLIVAAAVSCGCAKGIPTECPSPETLEIERTGLAVLRLVWTSGEGDYDGTIVERAFEDGEYSTLTRLPAGVLVYQDRTLSEEGTYRYRICLESSDARSSYLTAEYVYVRLPEPTGCTASMSGGGLVISWVDNCVGEEGYVVERKQGNEEFSEWKFLPPNASGVIDESVSYGEYEYRIMAYYGTGRSQAACCSYESFSFPSVAAGSLQSSWFMLSLPFTVTEDGGMECTGGICWSESGIPTVDDCIYVFAEPVSSGDEVFGNATDLEYGKEYTLRAWVRNDCGITYSEPVKGRIAAEPEFLYPEWNVVDYPEFPDAMKLYSTNTSVAGRAVNAWYVDADLSFGDIELRTVKADNLSAPSEMVLGGFFDTEVYAVVNGGYFGGTQSYSYVLDRGVRKSGQISSLSRTKTYNVTRGGFGVTEEGAASVKWLYSDKANSYDKPLPVYDGGPVLLPDETFPSERTDWDVYSAIGGAPVILKDGHICFDYLTTPDGKYKSNYELLQSDIYGPSVRAPRTAIGVTDEGHVVIMVVDGRNAGGSQGVTLDELACLMGGAGCTDALNLDGGGSTALCVTDRAELLNSPSDGAERKVCSFVALVARDI